MVKMFVKEGEEVASEGVKERLNLLLRRSLKSETLKSAHARKLDIRRMSSTCFQRLKRAVRCSLRLMMLMRNLPLLR